ncbi:hypothetical protein [Priestia koreensis]|uniref:hypothetical protein n=1 Tax=Priestia koreensis TaxID=284581 RepID=UPI00203ECE91|nr:hypothetical protein [Priestia koreensis]MCM3006849.1 hypothetical protein [Priestia koreensis]
MTNEEKLKQFQQRALQVTREHIEQFIPDLQDEKLQLLAESILYSSSMITAQLLAEYDDQQMKLQSNSH